MIKRLITISIVIVIGASFSLIAGCQDEAQIGSLMGSLVGAGVGQLAGGDSEATLIGAAVGGGIGYMLGNESDKDRTQAQMYSLREEMNHETVNITNSNGSICRVRLRKQGPGYVGTRGEYYSRLPSEDQLRPVYGF